MTKNELLDSFLLMYIAALEKYPKEQRPFTEVKNWVLSMYYEQEKQNEDK